VAALQQAPRRKKKKRRFKPLRRLLLVAILFLIMYGLFSAGKWVYGTLFSPRVKYTTVQAVDQSFYKGKAVVARDEFIIAAPKGGVVNKLVDHSSTIQAGQMILEIVDQALLSSIEKQLAEEAKKILDSSVQTDDAIQFKKDQLASSLSKVRVLSMEYAELVAKMEITKARQVFKELESAQKAADKTRQEYDLVASSQEQYETRRQELLNQRQQAIQPVVTPLNGVVSYMVDSFEGKLKPSDLNSMTLTTLKQVTSTYKSTENGVKVNAGQPVAKIVDDSFVYLLIETKAVEQFSGDLQCLIADEVIPITVFTKLPTSESGVHIVILKVISPPRALLEQRIIDTTIRSESETLVSIPRAAVWEDEGHAWVYVKATDGHLAKTVSMVQTSGNLYVVSGLSLGDTVVTNPKLVQKQGDQ